MQKKIHNTHSFNYDESQLKNKLTTFTKRLQDESLSITTLNFVDDLILSIGNILPKIQFYKHIILLGVGGSALGPQALKQSFAPRGPKTLKQSTSKEHFSPKNVWIIDNTQTPLFYECLNNLAPEETLVLVISKSGTTLPTVAQYLICKQWMQNAFESENYSDDKVNMWHKHFCIITENNEGFLREEVHKFNMLSLPIPEDLGGRFSIFSAVGMLTSAYLGIDYISFLKGANDAKETFFKETELYLAHNSEDNPASLPVVFEMAHFAFEAMEHDFSQLIFFSYVPRWKALGMWFRQLWSESLGKEGKGSTPIPTLGATDQHSILQQFLDGKKDKACLFLQVQKDNLCATCVQNVKIPTNIPEEWRWIAGKSLTQILEMEANSTFTTLKNTGMPLLSLELEECTEYNFGKLTWNLCLMTILTAYFLEIDPFTQPAVEQGKLLTKKALTDLE